jgi:hypothetical protein
MHVIPIGLYRSAAARGSEHPYVFTNPPPATILHRDDQVYVLPPPGASLSIDTVGGAYQYNISTQQQPYTDNTSTCTTTSTTASVVGVAGSINSTEQANDIIIEIPMHDE